MPAQALLVLAARGDEILAVVDQQAMSSAAPSRCALARFSIPSFSATRATLNAAIQSDLPRSRDECLAPAIGRGHFSDTPRWRTGTQRYTSPVGERHPHAAIYCPTMPSRVLACRAERCLTSRRPGGSSPSPPTWKSTGHAQESVSRSIGSKIVGRCNWFCAVLRHTVLMRAIRRLHAAGASMREIVDALGLWTQPTAWGRRRRGGGCAPYPLAAGQRLLPGR
jgi:hypothetical protein